MRRVAIGAMILALAADAAEPAAGVPPELLARSRGCRGAELALTRDAIEVIVAGTLALDFAATLSVLSRETVLQDLQDAYDLRVYAYPERTTARLLGRHLPLVRGFFRSKSEEMVARVAGLVAALCARQEQATPYANAASVSRLPLACGEETQGEQQF